jgi:FlaG/FlaF family flagellin (archaellin)
MRILDGQRAVSQALSVMLLVLITFVVGILLYSFVTGMVGNLTQPASTEPFSVHIDNVAINDTCITVYVRNSLNHDVTVDRAYVNNEPRAILATIDNKVIIPKSSTGKIQIPGSYSSGTRYEIKIIFVSGSTLFTMERY